MEDGKSQEGHLKKSLTTIDIVLLALSNIIGAGVFVMLTRTINFGGKNTIYAFILIAIISIISGLTYIEIVSIYKSNISEYKIVHEVFGDKIADITSYLLFLFAVLSAATITIALSKYMWFDKDKQYINLLISTFLIILMGIINYKGIIFSKIIFNTIGTVMIILLTTLIVFGSKCINISNYNKIPDHGISGFFLASVFALFLYNGYDIIVKIHDEVKEEVEIPRAMIITLTIVTIFYIGLVITAICTLSIDQIKSSYIPLSEMFKILLGNEAYTISFILGLVIMFNTSFVSLLGGTRFLYGLSIENKIPEIFSRLNKHSSPTYSIILACFIAFCIILTNNENFAVLFTNICVMSLLLIINISFVLYRMNNKVNDKEYKMPLYFGNIPLLPIIAVIGLLLLLIYSLYIIFSKGAFLI